MAVDMNKIEWWAMIVGNLAGGFLLAYIMGKANVSSVAGGVATGLVVGLLMSLSFDLIMYGVGKGMTLKGVAADVCAGAVMSAIIGGAIGWVYSMKRAVVAA
jgi:hypothetical protein